LTWLYSCARLGGSGGRDRKAETTGRMDLCHAQLFDIGHKAKSRNCESSFAKASTFAKKATADRPADRPALSSI
jgi:hypothetical protein